MVHRISDINTVVDKEVLPAHVGDYPLAAVDFTNWRFLGFRQDPSTSSKVVGKVMAFRLADQKIVWSNVEIDTDDLHLDPNKLFTLIDEQFEQAMLFILSYPVEHDVTTCTDPECFC